MKNYFKFILSIYVITFLSSCQKNISTTDKDIMMSNVKEIVGNEGKFVTMDELSFNKSALLSIEEFRYAYKEFKKSKTFTGEANLKLDTSVLTNKIKKASSTTTLDEFEDDGPRPAGYYHAAFPFYVSYYSSINDNILPRGFYTMHLDFNTDASGRIIGTPTLSFTGIGFFYWTYVNSSAITFNSANSTSTFTMTGNSLFGIQLGGLTLGWTERSTYYFTVNMDADFTKNAVRVEQK